MDTDYNLSDLDTPDLTPSDFTGLPVKRSRVDCDEVGLLPGTKEYKKARKRRQNRESAARSRARKKQEVNHLDSELDQVKRVNKKLLQQNAALTTENELLKKELEFFRDYLQTDAKPQKRTGSATSLMAVSLLCMVSFVCLMLPTSSGTDHRPGGRKLLFYSEETQWEAGYWSLGWLLIPVIAASAWWRWSCRVEAKTCAGRVQL
jgi:regulator of replication initiation timing